MANDISFVTGGAVFIGRHLVHQLVESGEHVRVLDIDCSPEPLPKGTEVVEGSVLNTPLLRKMMRGARRVYHLAANPNLWARDKASFHQTNVEGTLAVLKAAQGAGVERVIYTSTESILKGNAKTDGPIHEDVRFPGLSDIPGAYCKSKFLAERAAFDAASAGLPVIVVNPTIPVGPGDWKLTPPTRMLQGFLTRMFPAYLQCQLNLVPVEDVARGHILAAEKGRIGKRYILGGQNVMLSHLLMTMESLTGQTMPKRRVPYWLALITGAVNELVSDHITRLPPTAPLAGVQLVRSPSTFQSVKARTELGFEAGPLDAALARAIAWLSESGLLEARRQGKQPALTLTDRARKQQLGITNPS